VLHRVTQEWNVSRHSPKGWPQFLEAITIAGLRGWASAIEFRFPVVAIAGANGSGKTTVLKAAAAAYKARDSGAKRDPDSFYPDDFFPSTPWENVSGVALMYLYRMGDQTEIRHLGKRTKRWRGMPRRPIRRVFFLDVSRTQPIDTLIGYGKIAKQSVFLGKGESLNPEYLGILSRVLGVSYDAALTYAQEGKKVGVLEVSSSTYSNFHQGAGEDATADLITILQDVPRNSLVVIDEIESSLHPRAQRRLMTELLDLAYSKRLQFILSTHSPYIFEQLPAEARVFIGIDNSRNRQIIYGTTAEFALTMMDDVFHSELTVYCEDTTSATVVDSLIALDDAAGTTSKRIAIVPVGPASTVKLLADLGTKGALPGKIVGCLDGDQEQSSGCIVLPGGAAPERAVFESLTEMQCERIAARLGVNGGVLQDAIADAKRLPHHHAWTKRIAENLGPRVRPSRVWQDALSVWAEDLEPATRAAFTRPLVELLP
jgi:predicted ATPase